jgi:hypothetical protein
VLPIIPTISIASGPTAEATRMAQSQRFALMCPKKLGAERKRALLARCTLAGAVPTKSDAAAGIPFEVRISSAERPSLINNLLALFDGPQQREMPAFGARGGGGGFRQRRINSSQVDFHGARPLLIAQPARSASNRLVRE